MAKCLEGRWMHFSCLGQDIHLGTSSKRARAASLPFSSSPRARARDVVASPSRPPRRITLAASSLPPLPPLFPSYRSSLKVPGDMERVFKRRNFSSSSIRAARLSPPLAPAGRCVSLAVPHYVLPPFPEFLLSTLDCIRSRIGRSF